mmetsp:Transcript_40355/g.90587  ORF Transcript_40355/g.90587 Transcript_40355/m.90587 type:complete len:119 (-) Transcript_40355:301-657(-)|eukprot:CAMPEP_0172588654 /NCGR_PEP_ID=MMETSP1068-20121228/7532_1 /TAXON_ID=35684 /ORGANISM="Pseudopedinella elastica, Strain CCMP716" /LENGTH=118 /DNA_ID=CAMNT_0013384051 /DNA_START=106 /DNA_END=462 /DNA_ORIENTATION=-
MKISALIFACTFGASSAFAPSSMKPTTRVQRASAVVETTDPWFPDAVSTVLPFWPESESVSAEPGDVTNKMWKMNPEAGVPKKSVPKPVEENGPVAKAKPVGLRFTKAKVKNGVVVEA